MPKRLNHDVLLSAAGIGSIWQKIDRQRKRLLNAAPDGVESSIKSAVKMGSLRSQLKKTAGKLQETAPQLTIAGGGLFMTLNNWGLVPESDVLPLEEFNRVWQPDEPERFVLCSVCCAIPCQTLCKQCLCTAAKLGNWRNK